MYSEDQMLPLSGIQHYSFCPRQWALIHIEQQWAENVLTVQGSFMHERAHDRGIREKRGDTIAIRGLDVHSYSLGLKGQCDVVEFVAAEQGFPLAGEDGSWSVRPIEYKRGKSKRIAADRLQLCAQAICLEEMLCCTVETAYLYYHETRSREEVGLTQGLRDEAKRCAHEMHRLFSRRHTPAAKERSACRSCSMRDICLPKMEQRESVEAYFKRRVGEVI